MSKQFYRKHLGPGRLTAFSLTVVMSDLTLFNLDIKVFPAGVVQGDLNFVCVPYFESWPVEHASSDFSYSSCTCTVGKAHIT